MSKAEPLVEHAARGEVRGSGQEKQQATYGVTEVVCETLAQWAVPPIWPQCEVHLIM